MYVSVCVLSLGTRLHAILTRAPVVGVCQRVCECVCVWILDVILTLALGVGVYERVCV